MFAKTFQSPYDQYKHRVGQPFEVVGKVPDKEIDCPEETGDMWVIKFPDGEEIHAWPEEIIKEFQIK